MTLESTESDVLLPKGPESVPRDRLRMVYVIFYMLGIGTLLPWNFFNNAQSYFMFKLRNTTLYPTMEGYEYNTTTATEMQVMFESYLSVAAMLPNVLFMFLNTAATKLIRLRVRMIGAAVLMILLFGVTVALAKIDTDAWQTDFFAASLVTIVIMNAGSAVLQGGLFGLASMFPPAYIQSVMGGMGMGGTLAAMVNIMATAFASHKPIDMGFGYFLTAEAVISMALLGYLLLPLMKYARFHEEKQRRASEQVIAPQINSTSEETDDMSAEVSLKLSQQVPLLPVFKRISLHALCACLIFTTTLACFPSVVANISSVHKGTGTEWSEKYFTPVTCFLFFNGFDLLGRTFAGVVQWPDEDSKMMAVISVSRIIFIPLFWFCNVQPRKYIPVYFNSDIAPLVLMPLFALSNGYFSTLCMMYGPRKVPLEEVELAGAMMSFFLSLGLGLGSLCSFAFMNFIFKH